MSMVPLAGLVAAMADEEVPRVPVASLDAPLPATLDGHTVWITAILDRTAVFVDRLPLDSTVPRHLAGLRRFVVESSGLRTMERRDPQQLRRAAQNGRATQLKGTKSARLRSAASAAERELEALRLKVEADPAYAHLGAELDRIQQRMTELATIANSDRKAAGAA